MPSDILSSPTLRRLLQLAAWALLVAIVLATLVPLRFRPESGAPPDVERFAAFVAVSLAFVLAYPRHVGRVMLLIGAAAIALELAQLIDPTRDGRLMDLLVKLAGAAVGMVWGLLAVSWLQRRPDHNSYR